MTTTITVKARTEEVTEARPDAQGVWRATPTGRTRLVYDVLLDDDRYATTPDRAAAMRVAEERAFMADLVVGDASAVGALALYLAHGEG